MAKIVTINGQTFKMGKEGGVSYYVRNGQQCSRALPMRSKRSYHRPTMDREHVVMRFITKYHMPFHRDTISKCFDPMPANPAKHTGPSAPRNYYLHLNSAALREALAGCVDAELDGHADRQVSLPDIENAIAKYAAQHPNAILIAHKEGYRDVFLHGTWPDTITLVKNDNSGAEIVYCKETGNPGEVTIGFHDGQ